MLFTNVAACTEFKVQQPKYWILHKISLDKINRLLITPCHEAVQPEGNLAHLFFQGLKRTHRDKHTRENSQLKSLVDVSVLSVSWMIKVTRGMDAEMLPSGPCCKILFRRSWSMFAKKYRGSLFLIRELHLII